MTYRELIDKLAKATGRSKTETKELLDDTVSTLSGQLSRGKGVSIPELGTFNTKVKEVQKVYNPHYKKYMLVPPKRVVEFSPSSVLKDELKFAGKDDE
ncbi:HU family DNA-binding protein [Rhodohalobacter halophilus]|uniref:HU family DNA-binding protein n=1 Tax=Rhodohalobacter halophilus TaxID=1812810 RepID=UPI00083FBFA1|nr:HU family DNA-binding protein [Rhodohalobacter halophilus]